MSTTLAFREAGRADAPPLVLLHSITASGAMWSPQIPIWAQHFRVVAFDLPGHGDSAPLTGTPSIAALADAVANSCAAIGIANASFVGLSLGSMIAQRLAATRPALVRTAVMSNGVGVTPEPVKAIWQDRIDGVETGGVNSQVEATIGRWFTPDFAAASPVTMNWIRSMILATPAKGFLFAARAIQQLDHSALFGQIACPTLVLAGDHDTTAAPPPALKAMADAIPDARYATLPGAHLANVELPVAYAELVGQFLLDHAQ